MADLTPLPGLARQTSAAIQEALTLRRQLDGLRGRAHRSVSSSVLIDLLLTIVDRVIHNLLELPTDRQSSLGRLVALRKVFTGLVSSYADKVACALDGRLPWGQVYPLESLCRRISPESRILIYADSQSGYTYAEALAPLRRLRQSVSDLPGTPAPAEYPRFLAVFTFPDAESYAVLQNAAWAHEIGHHIDTVFRVSDSILRTPLFEQRLTAEMDADGARAADADRAAPAEEEEDAHDRGARTRTLEASFSVLRSWVQEVVADLFAVHVFGPASVLAFSEIVPSLASSSGTLTSHPPAWLRLALMLSELEYLGYDAVFHAAGLEGDAEKVRRVVARRVGELRAMCVAAEAGSLSGSREALIQRSVFGAREIIAAQVRANSRGAWRCEASAVAQDVFSLVSRLAHGLPPCEVDVAGQIAGRKTSVAAIVNAGWFFRIWRGLDAAPSDLSQAEKQHKALGDLNVLVLKAIELSAIKQQLGRKALRERESEVSLRGVLTRPDIKGCLARPLPGKLVITPLTDPDRQLGSNSIDLKLGYELLVPRTGRTTYLNLQQRTEAVNSALEAAHERVRLRIGDEFILHEHQFVMATTLEYVSLPPNLAGYVMGRSSWERAGLHVRPARIPPGYTGCIQLQLVSHKDLPIELITGARICQLLLFPASTPLADNRRGDVVAHPTFSAILDDEELVDLQKGRHHLILGIVSTLAAGEAELAEYFHEEHGFYRLSLATPVYEEARRRGLEITIPNLQDVGNSLRETHGKGVLVDRLRSVIQRLPQDANLVLTAIKNVGEVEALRRWPNFKLVSIDAPPDLRFSRACLGDQYGVDGSRDAFDRLDSRDRGAGEPPWGQQVEACMNEHDFGIHTNGWAEMREQFELCYSWVRSEMA